MDIFHIYFFVKIVMCVLQDENKLKRGRGWPIFLKKNITMEPFNDYIYVVKGPLNCSFLTYGN